MLGVGVLAREAFDRQRSRPVGVLAMLAEDSRPGPGLGLGRSVFVAVAVAVPVRIGHVER
jgi:hypothetical protein